MVLDNERLTLRGEACVLVPYRPEHVPVYHGWMGALSGAGPRTVPSIFGGSFARALRRPKRHARAGGVRARIVGQVATRNSSAGAVASASRSVSSQR